MARPAQLTDNMKQAALQLVQQAKTMKELRTGLSVLIPKRCGVANAVVGELLGVGVATVVRMQKQIRDQVAGMRRTKGKWGGRRRQLLSVEEETAFLGPWIAKAEAGGVLVVPPIHAALQELLGFKIPPSSVYRLLARHGWRKVEPDTCHPKQDAAAQEVFKKTSPKQWRKL